MPVYDDEEIKNREEAPNPSHKESADKASSKEKKAIEQHVHAGGVSETSASEKTKDSGGKNTEEGFYRHEGGKKSKLSGLGRLSSSKWKKRLLIGGLAGGGGGLLFLLIFFLFSSLMIPNFAQHIVEYQFARVSRTFANNAEETTAEKAAIDSADEGLFSSIKDTYQNVRDNTWGRFDKYRPNKVMENLQSDGRLQFNYETKTNFLGGQTERLSGVTFDGSTYSIDNGGFFSKFHPIQNFKNDVQLSRDFSAAFNDGLRDETGILIRGSVENQIREELGVSLIAWLVGRYSGKTEAEADAQIEQDVVQKVDNTSAAGESGVAAVDEAEQNAINAEKECMANPDCVAEEVANGGAEPAAAVAAMEGALDGWLLKFGSFLAGPVVTVGIPVCIIYSGSLEKSGPTIDAKNAELQRTFYYVASAADQQKTGDTTAEAVGATNWKLGNVGLSNPELRAGGSPVDTSKQPSPQASATGEFTVFSLLFGGTFGSFLNTIADKACPVITSPEGIVGLIAINLVTSALSGGSEEGLSTAVGDLVQGLQNQFLTVDGLKDFAGSTIKAGAAIGGATLLAKLLVAGQSGSLYNGLSTGVPFDNAADMGGNLNANEDMQRQFYGRPMTNAQVAESNLADQQFLAERNQSKSTFERYLDVHNPDSFASLAAMNTRSVVQSHDFASILTNIGKLFNPMAALPRIFNAWDKKIAVAEGTQDTKNYGIVQWGWSPDEENLMKSSPSYQPLENAKVFTDEWNDYHKRTGGDLDADIQSQFGECFTATMGKLLSEQKIVRSDNGDIVPDKGNCSPNNLSYINPFRDEPQSVFRWRLMKYYNAGLDQLISVQDAPGGP